MREPSEADSALVRDAANRLQLVNDRLIQPTPVRRVASLPFAELPGAIFADHTARMFRRQGLTELRQADVSGLTYHDPDDDTFKREQSAAIDRVADAVIRAAQEDRFS